jgi:hypothetical protein
MPCERMNSSNSQKKTVLHPTEYIYIYIYILVKKMVQIKRGAPGYSDALLEN